MEGAVRYHRRRPAIEFVVAQIVLSAKGTISRSWCRLMVFLISKGSL
jgi:hypothetical protein